MVTFKPRNLEVTSCLLFAQREHVWPCFLSGVWKNWAGRDWVSRFENRMISDYRCNIMICQRGLWCLFNTLLRADETRDFPLKCWVAGYVLLGSELNLHVSSDRHPEDQKFHLQKQLTSSSPFRWASRWIILGFWQKCVYSLAVWDTLFCILGRQKGWYEIDMKSYSLQLVVW